MHTVAILNRKGGTGKTTLAVHLAVAAVQQGYRTTLVDLDPQASASRWDDRREQQEPAVISVQSSRLVPTLERLRGLACEWVYLDTAPHSDGIAANAARVADLALVPCRPSILDVDAMTDTLELLRLYHTPAIVVLNATQARTKDIAATEAAIKTFEVPLCPVMIRQRVVFARAFLRGLTALEMPGQARAAAEMQALQTFLTIQFDGANPTHE